MKSFILSAIISAFIAVFFMSLFDNKVRNFLREMPDATFWIFAILFLAGYLLSLYWGITGIIKGQRLLNLLGICFSLFGLCIYVMGYMMNAGNGKETAGQFDHDMDKIEVNQKAALAELLKQINVKSGEVKLTNYWGMNKNPDELVLCIQKGNIIALQVKNKPITDIKAVSKLNHLNWLVLENCNLKSIAELDLPFLQRLQINNNRLTNLSGLENEPGLSWLDCRNNPITDSSALINHQNKSLYFLN